MSHMSVAPPGSPTSARAGARGKPHRGRVLLRAGGFPHFAAVDDELLVEGNGEVDPNIRWVAGGETMGQRCWVRGRRRW